MLGTNIQFGHVRAEDQFYIPVKARRNKNQKQQQRQQKQEAKTDEKDSMSPRSEVCVSASEKSEVYVSNLDRFLKSTMPSDPAQYFSRTTMRGWKTCDVEFQPYFTLGDLWESFKEWSTYGAGVPLLLDGSDFVVQYYAPYLSGIQLYGESKKSNNNLRARQAGEESEGDYCKDSSSDRSSDNDTVKSLKFSKVQEGRYHLMDDITSRISSFSVSDDSITTQEGFSSDDGETRNSRGCLLFEYLEHDSPYSREPLTDKILDLACQYPGLKTLRSCDLLPVSWISVAWYPIYRIPTGPTLKDLDACFLTYHSLYTPMRGTERSQAPFVVYPSKIDGVPTLALRTFGMASYKFKGSMWTNTGVSEHQLVSSLLQAAENRLRLLDTNHPDFQFFTSHGMYNR